MLLPHASRHHINCSPAVDLKSSQQIGQLSSSNGRRSTSGLMGALTDAADTADAADAAGLGRARGGDRSGSMGFGRKLISWAAAASPSPRRVIYSLHLLAVSAVVVKEFVEKYLTEDSQIIGTPSILTVQILVPLVFPMRELKQTLNVCTDFLLFHDQGTSNSLSSYRQ
jgi:hypothetical protein